MSPQDKKDTGSNLVIQGYSGEDKSDVNLDR